MPEVNEKVAGKKATSRSEQKHIEFGGKIKITETQIANAFNKQHTGAAQRRTSKEHRLRKTKKIERRRNPNHRR